MDTAALLDKLSEFLMVEQGGLELYRVAAARCRSEELAGAYETLSGETARHREVLVGLIEDLGGDPSYVSRMARLAQAKNAGLIEAPLRAGGLSPEELELSDLQNAVLVETVHHACWALLRPLALASESPLRETLERAILDLSAEDRHLRWAIGTFGLLAERHLLGPATRGAGGVPQLVIDSDLPVEKFHPAPAREHLLPPSQEPARVASVPVREVRAAAGR
jgi:hypothetical protein